MIDRHYLRLVLVGGVLTVAFSILPLPAETAGHGPVFGLATPTLGRGGWSLDVAAMGRAGDRDMFMLRTMIGYGVTEDFQVSLSAPIPLSDPSGLSQTRAVAMMPATRDVELSLGWRFHRRAVKVGARFESTAAVGLIVPTDASLPPGIDTAPGFYGSAVTGYASRSVYAWAGGLYRRYTASGGLEDGRFGDLALYSLVLGYRPPAFREDYPHPDWRAFVELVGEWTGRDTFRGVERPETGGHRVFLGPTLLGLYGSWGISGGVLFRVFDDQGGGRPAERIRFAVNVTWWF